MSLYGKNSTVMSTALPPPISQPPLGFRLVKFMFRRQIRGGSRLWSLMSKCGYFRQSVLFPVGPGVSIEVPIGRLDNFMDEQDLLDYEISLIETLCRALSQLPGPVTMVDGGADIGLFSVKMVANSSRIGVVHSFEPNPISFPYLLRNARRLPLDVTAHNLALADFDGRGELVSPPYDTSDHARFLTPDPQGGIGVTSVDRLNLKTTPSLLLKLDLEGGEMAALRGSVESIRRFANVVVAIEAHPEVCQLQQIDPSEMLTFLSNLRLFYFQVAEAPGIVLDPAKPFFSQFDRGTIYNIVAVSH
jgi:FkbM family methyltransferase